YRQQGISQQLLAEVEEVARARGCCKLTLEVLSGNPVAQASYQKFGFSSYSLNPKTGVALFWQKNL
ncbi:MAG: GNAT family N-acetyltransferase, partial [Gammaproteobacteria bacterium]|nr:GNAT family N-acetyltransferase [Gammaproteobacteria bacterium]